MTPMFIYRNEGSAWNFRLSKRFLCWFMPHKFYHHSYTTIITETPIRTKKVFMCERC